MVVIVLTFRGGKLKFNKRQNKEAHSVLGKLIVINIEYDKSDFRYKYDSNLEAILQLAHGRQNIRATENF